MVRQIKVNDVTDKQIDDLVKFLSKKNPLVRFRQDVVAKAVLDLYKKEIEK